VAAWRVVDVEAMVEVMALGSEDAEEVERGRVVDGGVGARWGFSW